MNEIQHICEGVQTHHTGWDGYDDICIECWMKDLSTNFKTHHSHWIITTSIPLSPSPHPYIVSDIILHIQPVIVFTSLHNEWIMELMGMTKTQGTSVDDDVEEGEMTWGCCGCDYSEFLSMCFVVERMMCVKGCFFWHYWGVSRKSHSTDMQLNKYWQKMVFMDKNKRSEKLRKGFLVIHLCYSKRWRKDSFQAFAGVFKPPLKHWLMKTVNCERFTHTQEGDFLWKCQKTTGKIPQTSSEFWFPLWWFLKTTHISHDDCFDVWNGWDEEREKPKTQAHSFKRQKKDILNGHWIMKRSWKNCLYQA